jgi:hypothetical protein
MLLRMCNVVPDKYGLLKVCSRCDPRHDLCCCFLCLASLASLLFFVTVKHLARVSGDNK